MDINIVPKFVDEAASPVAQAVGTTLANIWNLGIGNHISLWIQKQEVVQQQNLKDYIKRVEDKTQNIPEQFLTEPELHIVGPAIEASKFYIDSEELREMFANLIAASIDSRMSGIAHPSFVEIIKQISSDEAKLLCLLDGIRPISIIKLRVFNSDVSDTHFAEPLINFSMFPYDAGCVNPLLGPSYLENIERLGLIKLSYDVYNTNPGAYTQVENHPVINQWRTQVEILGKRIELSRGALTRTSFGEKFYQVCIAHEQHEHIKKAHYI